MTLTIIFSKNTILTEKHQATEFCWQMPQQHFFISKNIFLGYGVEEG
jgi:hypothetical protein